MWFDYSLTPTWPNPCKITMKDRWIPKQDGRLVAMSANHGIKVIHKERESNEVADNLIWQEKDSSPDTMNGTIHLHVNFIPIHSGFPSLHPLFFIIFQVFMPSLFSKSRCLPFLFSKSPCFPVLVKSTERDMES